MYTSVAYLGEMNEDIVSDAHELLVTAAGFYRVLTLPEMTTARPQGRGDYQLLYIASGRAHFTFLGEEHTLCAGQAVLYRPHEGQLYRYFAAEKPEVYWVHFTGCAVEDLLLKYGFLSEENLFFTDSAGGARALFDQMIAALRMRREGGERLLALLFEALLLVLSRARTEGSRTSFAVQDEIERAVRYFSENYNRPISVERYADGCHMSVSGFIRHFTRVTRQTPMQYILSARLTAAKNLLEHTDRSVSQISSAVGYENALYFSRLFRRHTGVSPSAYRKRFLKTATSVEEKTTLLGEDASFVCEGAFAPMPKLSEICARMQDGDTRTRLYGDKNGLVARHEMLLTQTGERTHRIELHDRSASLGETAISVTLFLPDGLYEMEDEHTHTRASFRAKQGWAHFRLRLTEERRSVCIWRVKE